MKIIMHIDKKEVIVNEEEKTMDVAPVVIDNRVLVPVRFLAETLGYVVDYRDGKITIER